MKFGRIQVTDDLVEAITSTSTSANGRAVDTKAVTLNSTHMTKFGRELGKRHKNMVTYGKVLVSTKEHTVRHIEDVTIITFAG